MHILRISILVLGLLLAFLSAFSQATRGFSYQAVARDEAGTILESTPVILGFRIREGVPEGSIIYQEVHPLQTNSLGLINAVIGEGTAEIGDFSTLDWGAGEMFLEVQLNGASVETTTLRAVPYAKVATDMKLADLKDVEAGSVFAGDLLRWDGNAWRASPAPEITLSGAGATTVTGRYPDFTISSQDEVADADADPTNEVQTLSLSGSTLSLSLGGGSVSLASIGSAWTVGTNGRLH